MFRNRVLLEEKLRSILGSNNVYFQPPSNRTIEYPAIIYSLNDVKTISADNNTYAQHTSYNVVVVDYKPNSVIADKISKLPMCRLRSSPYVSNNLNHFPFTLFY